MASVIKFMLLTFASIFLPVLLIIISLNILIKSDLIYEYNLSRFNISERTTLPVSELKEINSKIKDYFFNDEKFLEIERYNDREIAHMKDVKKLINDIFSFGKVSSIFFVMSIVILIEYFKVDLSAIIKYSLSLFTSLIVFLGIGLVLFFNAVFLMFHKLSFNNDLWILDPANDYLLMMFPEDFFRDIALTIVFLALLMNVATFFLVKIPNDN